MLAGFFITFKTSSNFADHESYKNLTSWHHSVAKTLNYMDTSGDLVLDQFKVRYTSTNTKMGDFLA